MTETYSVKKGTKLTEEQLKMLEEAKDRPIMYDEDSPEPSKEILKALKCAASARNRRNRKKA